MAIALTKDDQPATRRIPHPTWVDILLQNDVPQEWINELHRSWISDSSRDARTGTFVDPHAGGSYAEWTRHVPCMICSNVPVYIRWSSYDNSKFDRAQFDYIVVHHPWLKLYMPDLDRIWAVPDDGPALMYTWRGQNTCPTHFR
ncbi:hypothetical protein GSI_09468 [Ganoderma sinense ZZ0214-1]|uniref:Uncharacterized protein n=1 Tax=Ganoderma sinense ZZ0214-1 TaxID=1077348 RepID=A0A2G8S6L2_9APHY|nr:hypothetical protein GSI_09468 [Ganoderma sinense ZZ0214-1]